MDGEQISKALKRARSFFAKRPEAGVHADSQAIARWEDGLRVVARHESGAMTVTDMPTELGGGGVHASPGWFLRAGLASCLTTRIVMEAADRGVKLKELEVRADSWSDARGLLGMHDDSGARVSAAALRFQLTVHASAENASEAELQSMIEECHRCSPLSAAIQSAVPITLSFESE